MLAIHGAVVVRATINSPWSRSERLQLFVKYLFHELNIHSVIILKLSSPGGGEGFFYVYPFSPPETQINP